MNLETYTPATREEGDRLPASEIVGRPLIVLVREHKTGIKTQFNQDPKAASYRPDGGDAVLLDIADLSTGGGIYCGVLWFNGALVDGLKTYVGQALPVKLFYDNSKTGGNAYLNVEPLVGAELAVAHQWAAANPDRFETERAARAAASATAPTNGGMAPIPGAPSQPPAWAVPTTPPPAPTPVATTPATPTAAPATPAPAAPAVDVNDPAIAALLAQLAAQNR